MRNLAKFFLCLGDLSRERYFSIPKWVLNLGRLLTNKSQQSRINETYYGGYNVLVAGMACHWVKCYLTCFMLGGATYYIPIDRDVPLE